MTAGRKWTAAIALGVALMTAIFGLPAKVHVVATPSPVARAAAASPPAAAGENPALPSRPLIAEPASASIVGGEPPEPARAALRITALVAGDDIDLVNHLLPGARTVDVRLAPADLCAQVGPDPGVVVTALAIPAAAVACLEAAGALVIGHLPEPSGSAAKGAVISTSLGSLGALRDTGAWLATRDEGKGKVGLVLDGVDDATKLAMTAALADGGVRATSVAALASTDDVPQAVIDFRVAGIQTVVFAVKSDVRQQFVSMMGAALAPAWIVTDVDFGTWATGDAAPFDGALARTVLRAPWSEAPPCVAGLKLVSSLMDGWCTHAPLAIAAAAAGSVPDAYAWLARRTAPSALTTELGPSASHPWGPTTAVVLRYSSACTCWQKQ